VPTFSRSFDSGEPFCTSQTVSMMNRKNWRYSDCQFSATSAAKLDELWPDTMSVATDGHLYVTANHAGPVLLR
jgi:hypothetical protein